MGLRPASQPASKQASKPSQAVRSQMSRPSGRFKCQLVHSIWKSVSGHNRARLVPGPPFPVVLRHSGLTRVLPSSVVMSLLPNRASSDARGCVFPMCCAARDQDRHTTGPLPAALQLSTFESRSRLRQENTTNWKP